MGNSCPKCETESEKSKKNENLINISEHCIERLTRESLLEHGADMDDDTWMKKLKCFDDIHSNENGLTIQTAEALMKDIEAQIGFLPTQVCPKQDLIECLKSHPNQLIKCMQLMDEFIDCVDKTRIEIIKKKVKSEASEQNELAKQLLKATAE